MSATIPFEQKELEIVGNYPPMVTGLPPLNKYQTPITPKENFKLLAKGENHGKDSV